MLTLDQETFLNNRHIHFTSTCWIWLGCLKKASGSNLGGYSLAYCPDIKKPGVFHRYAYRLWKGPIPDGLQIDHLCRNRACVNPSHLEAVTGKENQRRASLFVTHCPLGHPYNEENTYFKYGYRKICRTCHREREARRRSENPERHRLIKAKHRAKLKMQTVY